jgi:hypothetical protein
MASDWTMRLMALGDVVEPTLARALVLAAEAGQWGLVERIAAELGVSATAIRQTGFRSWSAIRQGQAPARS